MAVALSSSHTEPAQRGAQPARESVRIMRWRTWEIQSHHPNNGLARNCQVNRKLDWDGGLLTWKQPRLFIACPVKYNHWLFTQTGAMAMMLHTDRAIRPGAVQDAPSWVYLWLKSSCESTLVSRGKHQRPRTEIFTLIHTWSSSETK